MTHGIRPAALFFSAQLLSTITRKGIWPLCSFDMFGYEPADEIVHVWVRLRDANGWGQPHPVWGLLPMETFRVHSAIVSVFFNDSPIDRDSVAEQILDRLNTRQWSGFDQVRESLRPNAGEFDALALFAITIPRLTNVDLPTAVLHAAPDYLFRRPTPAQDMRKQAIA